MNLNEVSCKRGQNDMNESVVCVYVNSSVTMELFIT